MKNACANKFKQLKRSFNLAFLFICSVGTASYGAEQNISAFRSAYLYYFANLIDWPNQALFSDNAMTLCAITNDESDKFQLSTINNKRVNNKYLKIIFWESSDSLPINRCNIVFISSNNSLNGDNLFLNTAKQVLIVTEGETNIKGAIKLYTDGSKLRFQIDSERLSTNGFKVSSKLLRLSKKEGK